jgi:hypothetical protein
MVEPSEAPIPQRTGALLAARRQRLERLLGARLVSTPPTHIAQETLKHLVRQAEELYWEELSWERLTNDEGVGADGLVELTFPGFLAFIEGLLLREVMPDAHAPASPRPEVVEDILLFLERRHSELDDASDPEQLFEREITLRLIDLILYRLHDLAVDEVDRLDLAHIDDDD